MPLDNAVIYVSFLIICWGLIIKWA